MITNVLLLCLGFALGALLMHIYNLPTRVTTHGDWIISNWKSHSVDDVYYVAAYNKKKEDITLRFLKNGDVDVYCHGDIKETVL